MLRRSRGRLRGLLVWAAIAALMTVAAGLASVEWEMWRGIEPPPVAPVDVLARLFDLRSTEVVTTVGWTKVALVVPRHRFLTDHTIWRRMHFEDWDRLPSDLRAEGLRKLLERYGHLVHAPAEWPSMTAGEWDLVPQPIRAMAFVGMIDHWIDVYAVGLDSGLPRRDVRQTVKAIAMTESWFDHRAQRVNRNGSSDLGLGGASGFARRTVRRLHEDGRCDFSFADEEYYDPWRATRFLAFWFNLTLQEAGGDLDLAIRAYNRGIGSAVAGAGQSYRRMVGQRRQRYLEGPSGSPTWRELNLFRQDRLRSARAHDRG